MTKKISASTPENSTATLGSNPISSGRDDGRARHRDAMLEIRRRRSARRAAAPPGMITPEVFSFQRGK